MYRCKRFSLCNRRVTISSKIIEVVWSVAKQEKIHLVKLVKFLESVPLNVRVVGVDSLVRSFSLCHVMERELVVDANSLQYFYTVISHRINP